MVQPLHPLPSQVALRRFRDVLRQLQWRPLHQAARVVPGQLETLRPSWNTDLHARPQQYQHLCKTRFHSIGLSTNRYSLDPPSVKGRRAVSVPTQLEQFTCVSVFLNSSSVFVDREISGNTQEVKSSPDDVPLQCNGREIL